MKNYTKPELLPETIILNNLKLRLRLLLKCRKYGFDYTMNNFYNYSNFKGSSIII